MIDDLGDLPATQIRATNCIDGALNGASCDCSIDGKQPATIERDALRLLGLHNHCPCVRNGAVEVCQVLRGDGAKTEQGSAYLGIDFSDGRRDLLADAISGCGELLICGVLARFQLERPTVRFGVSPRDTEERPN